MTASDIVDQPERSFRIGRARRFKLKKSPIVDYLTDALMRRARRNSEKRIARGKIRTMWASTPILTLPILAKCDRLLGFRSSSVVFNTYYITRSFDINLILFEGAFRLARSRRALALFRWLVFAWGLLRFDVFNYFYDRGLLLSVNRYGINPKEIELLFRSGKRLYTYAYGADVRTREITSELGTPNICQECPQPGKYCICTTDALEESLRHLAARTNAQIAMGDMTAYVPGCINMHYWPIEAEQFAATPPDFRIGDILKVAHTPNHGFFKGTHYLVEAIDRLVREGERIELVTLQGVSNKKVIELFQTSHIVADQFVAGFHGYTALEAMAMAKPVLCFLRNDQMMIDPATCPIINTHPERIYDVLKRCLRGEIDLKAIGSRGRLYVEKYYSLKAVAARLGMLYINSGAFPDHVNSQLKMRIDALAS